MRVSKKLATVAALTILGMDLPSASAKVNSQCFKETSPVQFSYCVYKDTDSTSSDYLYFFHGRGGNEKSWAKDGSKIYSAWKSAGEQAPTVISVTFPGKYWILAKKYSSRPQSGLYEAFRNQIVPKIESRLGALQGSRMAYGMSMGGINVASLITKDQNLFDKAAIVCPVIPEFSPYDYAKALTYLAKGMKQDNLKEVILIGSSIYPNTDSWKSEYPLYVVRDRFNSNSPDVYLSAGNKDEYGIYQDAKNLSDAINAKGGRSTWEGLSGKHCVFNYSAIARFLSN